MMFPMQGESNKINNTLVKTPGRMTTEREAELSSRCFHRNENGCCCIKTFEDKKW